MTKSYKRAVFVVFIFTFILAGGLAYQANKAESQEDVDQQIAELLQTIKILEEQLALLQSDGRAFTKNLRLGDRGEDVRRLQQILNADSQTRVALSGAGSPGNESDFFGNLTRGAVIRFQNKYASEILHPLGLFSGTGFVGESTRKKLNELTEIHPETTGITLPPPVVPELPDPSLGFPLDQIGQSEIPNNFNFSDSFLFDADAELPMPTLISPSSAEPGTEVTLYGSGFTATGNTVHFGDQFSLPNLPSANNSIKFQTSSDIPFGPHDLSVSNSKGVSETKVFFIMTSPSGIPPTVSHITPSEGPYGTEITIHGSGFTPTGNQVRSNIGVFNNLESTDGETLKLKVEPFSGESDVSAQDVLDSDLDIDWEIHLFVSNENGISSDNAVFTLKI